MAVPPLEDDGRGSLRDRARTSRATRVADDEALAEASSPVVRAAERMVKRIESLVEEIARLRADNEELRRQLRGAIDLFEKASSALAEPRPRRRGAAPATPAAAPARRRRPRSRAAKGRATPPEVTTEVVRAVIAKLGQGTASEIASEITRAGVKVSGRAIRFLAERAGAETFRGEDGRRRYRF